MFRRAATAAVARAISASGAVGGGAVVSRGAYVAGSSSISRFVTISRTDVIVFLSPVARIC